MNINFQVQADFDLAKIPLRGWDRQLKKSANIVTKDHFERLERGKGVSGDRLRALKESTILRKRRQKRPPLRSPETPPCSRRDHAKSGTCQKGHQNEAYGEDNGSCHFKRG